MASNSNTTKPAAAAAPSPTPARPNGDDGQTEPVDTGNSSRSNNLVTVGCKLPNGLQIHLDQDNALTDYVMLNGANSSSIVGGYGMTAVDKEFATEWFKRYANAAFVKNGAVFMVGTDKEAEKEAQNRSGVMTGFEGANAKTPIPGTDVTEEETSASSRAAERR